jgi:hypothetical protein
MAAHPVLSPCDGGRTDPWDRWLQPESPVWTVGVVVLDIDPKDLVQVASPDDEQPVQAHGVDRPDPAFRVGVRVGRLHRRHEHVDSLRPEHVVEPAAELRPGRGEGSAPGRPGSSKDQQQVPGLLGDQRPLGLAVTPATTSPVAGGATTTGMGHLLGYARGSTADQ